MNDTVEMKPLIHDVIYNSLAVLKATKLEEVKDIMLHDDMQRNLGYNLDNIQALFDSTICYKLVIGANICGVCLFKKINDEDKIYIVDVGFLPKYRGPKAYDLGRLALKNFFKEIDCNLLITMIRHNNTASRYYATSLGFKRLPFRKNDDVLMYITGDIVWAE